MFFLLFLSLFLGFGYLAGNYMVNYALKRGNDVDAKALPRASTIIHNPDLFAPTMPSARHEELTVTSDDGLRLVATAFYPDSPSNLWVILIAGYGRHQGFAWNYADEYLSKGFNILTPDLRAIGKSAGEYITMGAKESDDITCWINAIKEKNPHARIVLHGVSMGAATAMLTAAKSHDVAAVIDDCGYSDAYEILSEQMEKIFGLPRFPVMNFVDIVCHWRTGVYLSDASPIKAVTQSNAPMLFIHGDADRLVPPDMMERLYDASHAQLKEKLLLKDVEHAVAMPHDREKYFAAVFGFLTRAAITTP